MDTTSKIEKSITKTTSISITSTGPEIDLSSPLWAVNWFNTKRRWLYSVYTYLATPLVLKVGGSLCYKGEHIEKLKGDEKYARNMLLIVKYPSAKGFFKLMDFKKFIFISILRLKAVKNFIFGYTQPIEIDLSAQERKRKGAPCLVFHFRSETDLTPPMQTLLSAAVEKGITLAYAGTKAATLHRTMEGRGTIDIPFFMDGIVVLEGNNRDELKDFFASDICQDFITKIEDSYVALFRKLA